MFPNLIIAGAGKSGTSSLHLYLDQHPDIAMTTVKEPHFFSDTNSYATGPSFYADLYPPDVSAARYRGESSTGYLIFPAVPERIHASVPDCQLIFLLRNPIDRAISHYRWLVGLGLESRGFRETVDSDRDEIPDPATSRAGAYGYIYQEGCYASHIERFASQFAAGQILLLHSDALRSDPLSCLNSCFRFLGLTELTAIDTVTANETFALRYPRLRARLEGRAGTPGARSGRARTAAKAVLGQRRAARLRANAVSSLGARPLDVPIDVPRTWLAENYTADVALLRAHYPDFGAVWREDFPE